MHDMLTIYIDHTHSHETRE